MRNLFRISCFILLCAITTACGSKKNTTASAPQPTPAPATPAVTIAPTPVPVANPKGGGVRFVVSFFSQGEGIDLKTKEEFTRFLDTYPKKIGYEPVQWGREGELDYCLSLNNLTADEQTEFVQKAQVILSKSRLVHTKENAACEHKVAIPPAAEDDVYRLVVSFYSEGGGADMKAKEDFEKFLNNHSKKISFEPTGWGREGETDYCLKLSELSSAEQADFVRKAKEILAKTKLVHVDENAKCVHKH